jgi:plasmid stabilization system protein ParE
VARTIVWARAALDDLDAALEFVAGVSESFASTLAQDARDASRSLSRFAERGRVVPEVGHSQLRELFVREHRMIYRVEEVRVTIVAFFHGRRDFETAWHTRARS